MSLFRQGKTAEAREVFAAAEARSEPRPTGESSNSGGEGDPLGTLMSQIAQREAKALLAEPAPAGK